MNRCLIPVRTNRTNFGFGELGRVFDEFFDIDLSAPRFFAESAALKVDIKDEEDKVIVKAEMPGLSENNLDVEFEDGYLTVKAEFKEENEDSLRTGKYSWARDIPNVDADKIEARLKDGVCTITLPKMEAAKPKRIAINT